MANYGVDRGVGADGTGSSFLENLKQIIFREQAVAPDTPGAGKVTLYAKEDGLLYFKDDTGAETAIDFPSAAGDALALAIALG